MSYSLTIFVASGRIVVYLARLIPLTIIWARAELHCGERRYRFEVFYISYPVDQCTCHPWHARMNMWGLYIA
jgi:hypothetical protein